MKTKTWICPILSGLLLYGISAYAGGAQCAAEAKEAAAQANVVEETKSSVTSDAEEATLVVETSPVSEKPPVLSESEVASLVEIARDALDAPQSPPPLLSSTAVGLLKITAADSMDVAVAGESELEVHEETQEDSETEVVEETK